MARNVASYFCVLRRRMGAFPGPSYGSSADIVVKFSQFQWPLAWTSATDAGRATHSRAQAGPESSQDARPQARVPIRQPMQADDGGTSLAAPGADAPERFPSSVVGACRTLGSISGLDWAPANWHARIFEGRECKPVRRPSLDARFCHLPDTLESTHGRPRGGTMARNHLHSSAKKRAGAAILIPSAWTVPNKTMKEVTYWLTFITDIKLFAPARECCWTRSFWLDYTATRSQTAIGRP